MKRNTLDLDFNDKELVDRVYRKIYDKKCCSKIALRPSCSGNGFHVELECSKNCDLCRLVFDDQVRYMLDTHYRKVSEKDVLFDRKTYWKCGRPFSLHSGFWQENVF